MEGEYNFFDMCLAKLITSLFYHIVYKNLILMQKFDMLCKIYFKTNWKKSVLGISVLYTIQGICNINSCSVRVYNETVINYMYVLTLFSLGSEKPEPFTDEKTFASTQTRTSGLIRG